MLTAEGKVGCRGRRDGGSLGDDAIAGPDEPLPTAYVCSPAGCGADLENVVALSARETTCALLADRTVWCWGPMLDASFQGMVRGLPTQICETGADPAGCPAGEALELVSIDVGQGFACGVRPDGRAVCWALTDVPADRLGGGMPLTQNQSSNHPDPVVEVCTQTLSGPGGTCAARLLDAAVRGCGALEVVEVTP